MSMSLGATSQKSCKQSRVTDRDTQELNVSSVCTDIVCIFKYTVNVNEDCMRFCLSLIKVIIHNVKRSIIILIHCTKLEK